LMAVAVRGWRDAGACELRSRVSAVLAARLTIRVGEAAVPGSFACPTGALIRCGADERVGRDRARPQPNGQGTQKRAGQAELRQRSRNSPLGKKIQQTRTATSPHRAW